MNQHDSEITAYKYKMCKQKKYHTSENWTILKCVKQSHQKYPSDHRIYKLKGDILTSVHKLFYTHNAHNKDPSCVPTPNMANYNFPIPTTMIA